MKQKFIRILSPILAAVIFLLDAAVIGFAVFAVKKLTERISALVIIFTIIEIFAIIIGILVTKEIFKNGAVFYEDRFEFNGIDNDNIFEYKNIEGIETYHDTSASLKKNFIDRHTLLIITQNDDTVTTVDIGLATKKTVKKIMAELEQHIDKAKIK